MTAPSPASAALLASARALRPRLRAAAAHIDAERRLPPDLLAAMQAAGLFRAILPRTVSGFELDPLSYARLIEEVATGNGSAGWVLLIAGNTGYLTYRQLPAAHAQQMVVSAPEGLVVGSVDPPGRARRVPGGYRVSGHWRFASGSVHAAWFSSLCGLVDETGPLIDATGQPRRGLVVTPASAVTIHDTWDSLGLRGSSSHDYSLDDVFVAESWYVPDEAPVTVAGPLFVHESAFILPAGAAHALGIARGALDALTEFVTGTASAPGRPSLRDNPQVLAELGRAEGRVAAARFYLYGVLENLWTRVCAAETIGARVSGHLRLATVHAVTAAVEAVDSAYALAGSSAVFRSSPLERSFRDIHTAATHVAYRPPAAYAAGEKLLLSADGAGDATS